MSRHTPGPWRAVRDERGMRIIGSNHDAPRCYEFIAIPLTGMKNGVMGANARLIAAAPELLEALEEITNISPATHGPEEAADAAVRIAADAIAKVKGEVDDA